jgi:hypothetical protein
MFQKRDISLFFSVPQLEQSYVQVMTTLAPPSPDQSHDAQNNYRRSSSISQIYGSRY